MDLDVSKIKLAKWASVSSSLFGRRIGGVLGNDADFRNFMLYRNIGKYGLFDEPMYPEIGSVYNPYERVFNQPTDTSGINGILGYNNGVIDKSLIDGRSNQRIKNGTFVDVDQYADADVIAGLLDKKQFLGNTLFSRLLNDSIEDNTPKTVYSSNGGRHNAGESLLRETIRGVEDYLARTPYVDRGYVPDHSIKALLARTTVVGSDVVRTRRKGLTSNTISVYNEDPGNGRFGDFSGVDSSYGTNVEIIPTDGHEGSRSLIRKTNELFYWGTVRSLINRFHTTDEEYTKGSDIISAYDPVYGLSRGRNLLKKKPKDNSDPNNTNYDNPYCRVWTSHHQYSKMIDRIRPFADESTGENFASLGDIQKGLYGDSKRPNGGSERLGSMSVLQSNGLVNITPKRTGNDLEVESVKRCMFSIENLAWKDLNVTGMSLPDGSPALSADQRGPNGGRIMWFPPYNLTLHENINPEWNSNTIIGRGEDILTYTKTVRRGTLDFTLLVDHPSVLSIWAGAKSEHSEEDEMDVHRFFAGCQMTMDYANAEDETPKQPIVVQPITTPPITPVETYEASEIKIILFFPNNLTGVDATGDDMDEVIEYIVSGYSGNTRVSDVGYEMMEDQPSSIYSEYRQKAVDINGNDTTWGYLVDEAYVNQRLEPENYEDSESGAYNSRAGLEKVKTLIDESFDEGKLYAFDELAGLLISSLTTGSPKEIELGNILNNQEAEPTIVCEGFATSHGSESTSQSTVALNRANFVKRLLVKHFKYNGKNISNDNVTAKGSVVAMDVDNDDINSEEAKLNRRVCITISLPQAVDNNAYSGTEIKEEEMMDGGEIIPAVAVAERTATKELGGEYLYFKQLKEKDPLVFQKVIDKVKYFQPAFHSISPEGFNERLTFLNQCTRQGPTLNSSSMATNLAFGRAPYCVLRIGDFFNTKILIESVSVGYDEGGWDLNPEGIGVQPMMAKVSLTFMLLGGSDLSGPIERLQNAVSFNYYSNTSVYDARADYRQKFVDEESEVPKHWEPTFTGNMEE